MSFFFEWQGFDDGLVTGRDPQRHIFALEGVPT